MLQGKIPISIHPLFWVLAFLIGWIQSQSFIGIFIWVLVIVISVLFHELGHAFTAKFFGLHPKIELIAFGGVTSYENKRVVFWKQFLIVLNGPLFGIGLFLFCSLIIYLNIFTNIYVFSFFKIAQIVNLFWSIVNLLPVLPLDGGQLLRIALEGFFGIRGFRLSLFIGSLVALLFSIFFFIRGGFLIGALFFLFAFQSFDSWRKSKYVTSSDRDIKFTSILKKAERLIKEGKKEEAVEALKKIRKIQKEGITYNLATHYLAMLYYEMGEKKEAYDLFLKIEDQLEDKAKEMVHELAFYYENYDLVIKLSAEVYQKMPSFDVAWRNARAFAWKGFAKEAGGWVQTSSSYEDVNVQELIKDSFFDRVRDQKGFLKFFS